jgi:hypothetical protein
MKDAERATYTFIAEMEEGGSISAQDLVKKNAGGASVHASQDLRGGAGGDDASAAADGIKVLSISGTSSAPMPAKKVVAKVAYTVGEKCQALWTDGKYYTAQIMKVIPDSTKYQIKYLEYGNVVNIEGKALKKAAAPAAGAKAPAAGAKPAAGRR